MKYIDLFAGIGGFHYGIDNAISAECVYSNEWDKYANSVYRKHYSECDNRDIRTVEATEIPDHDLLVGGFPCQSFSVAGKRGGFNDTRGTLFFEIARILKQKQPRLCILENVKGLLSHDQGRTFATIITTIDELGYDLQWQVLNSKDFGVPQNRERVFIIGNRRGTRRPNVFPLEYENDKLTIDEKVYTLSENVSSYSGKLLLGMAQHEEEKLSREQMQELFKRIRKGIQEKECSEVEREPQKIRQQSEGNIQEIKTLGAFMGGSDDTGTVCGVVQIPTEDMLLLWTSRGDAFQRIGQIQQQDASDDHRQDKLKRTLQNWQYSPLLFAVQPYQGRLFYSIGDGRDWINVYSTEMEVVCKENSLSSILEEHVDPKYFLSQKSLAGILKGIGKPQLLEHSPQEGIQEVIIQR